MFIHACKYWTLVTTFISDVHSVKEFGHNEFHQQILLNMLRQNAR